MPTFFYSTDASSSGNFFDASTSYDTLVVMPGVNIYAEAGDVFSSSQSGTDVYNYGFIAGQYMGIDFSAPNDGHYHVLIGADGGVFGLDTGVRMRGPSSELINEGSITGQNYGVIFGGNGSQSSIFNSGTISGQDALIRYYGDTSQYTIVNTGTIMGGQAGHAINVNSTNAVETVVNQGLIMGDVLLGGGLDLVRNVNGGVIEGDVLLGADDDRYHGRTGEVNGTVFGEAGNDVFTQNSNAADVFDGGDDRDELNFRLDGAAIVALDGGFDNAGAAQGDTYINFEMITGSAYDDHFQGDDAANTLWGRSGDDILSGMGGHDLLIGGVGSDTMTGGDGFDRFSYENVNEFGDVITDFSNVSGNNDRFTFLSTAFNNLAIGTVVPGRFAANADHQAQDANDYFLYDTDDHELWYDVDGNGAAEAVLVAALETSTVLTYLDIEIV